MATYNGWLIVDIPSYPPAPASIEFVQIDAVSKNKSPFTFESQIQNWNATGMEASVTLPPMTRTNALPWIAFLRSMQGIANVFQFSAAFMAAYPEDLGSRYWRLKANSRKWSVLSSRLYSIQFDIEEAI